MASLESLAGSKNVAPISRSPVTHQLGGVTVSWGGDGFKEKVRAAAAEGCTDGAVVVARKMKQLTGIQGPPRSTPGNPPHKDTTSLFNAITVEVATPSNLAAGAGIQAGARNTETGADVNDYALDLEFGSSRAAPRPWILRSLAESRGAIFGAFTETFARTLGGGVKGVS